MKKKKTTKVAKKKSECAGCASKNIVQMNNKVDWSDLTGLEKSTLTFKSVVCKDCGFENVDENSKEVSRVKIIADVLSAKEVNRVTMSFLYREVFKESFLMMANEAGYNPQFLKKVLSGKLPLSADVAENIMSAAFVKFGFGRDSFISVVCDN